MVIEEQNWARRRVTITSLQDERETGDARVLIPPTGYAKAGILATIIFLILLIPSVFFPPILLLNFPIIYIRHMLRQRAYNRAHFVSLAFRCLHCKQLNPEMTTSGNLPLKINCIHCNTPLKVELEYSNFA